MNNIDHQLIDIFCQIDDFCKNILPKIYPKLYLTNDKKSIRGRKNILTLSETLTILVMFGRTKCKYFKHFYTNDICSRWIKYFPKLPSYTRFLAIRNKALMPLVLFLNSTFGKKTGIYYIDSTNLSVCKNQRIKRHKVFNSLASRGHNSMGFFFGFKLHMVINHIGEIMNIKITKGNVHDSKCTIDLLKNLSGYVAGDKGYICKKNTAILKKQNLHLLTKTKKNMKQKKLSESEKIILSKRYSIETVIDCLKNGLNIWHSNHRSALGGFVNLLAGLISYNLNPLRFNFFSSLSSIS
jgi:hypothetical protein